jgi:flagellar biosynthesis anti-sigma factor FlgM
MKTFQQVSMNASTERATETDQLNLSPRAQEIQQAGQMVAQTSEEIRETKIVALRRDVANGRYHVHAEQIAEKIVKDHLLNLLH